MLHEITKYLFAFFAHLGGLGLLMLGVLDSSFLFLPLGNDLLLVGMSSRRPDLMPYYVVMAVVGSVLGSLLADMVGRKGGEKGLDRHVSPRHLAFVHKRVKKDAGYALALASVMPPPFPYTPFVLAAAALEYPRKKLLAVVAVSRLVRFSAIGVLAVLFGTRILRWASAAPVQDAILALAIICVVGSVLSVVGWIKRSQRAA